MKSLLGMVVDRADHDFFHVWIERLNGREYLRLDEFTWGNGEMSGRNLHGRIPLDAGMRVAAQKALEFMIDPHTAVKNEQRRIERQ